jgi:hypothetical protein
MWKKATGVLLLALLISGCSSTPPPPEQALDWSPSQLALSPTVSLVPQIATDRSRPPLGKFSLRFYQKLKAHPVIAPLAEVDIWGLRDHPRQYDIITVGPASFREYSGRKELLDQLTTTHGLTKEKAEVLTDWLRTGGILWVEFGVFIQGYEWIRSNAQKVPALPDLAGFTIFGLPTHCFVFEAERSGAFTIMPAVFSFHNEAQHPATADIRQLKLRQSDLKTIYPIINGEAGESLVRDGNKVYATVVPFGDGKIISTLPFDRWDAESDGEKYRINLLEWLAGYPIPAFDPRVDVERLKD